MAEKQDGALVGADMRTALKRVVMWAYCRDYICASTVAKVFARFGLKEH